MYRPKIGDRVKTQYVPGGKFFEGTAKQHMGSMTVVHFDGAQCPVPWPNEQLSPVR